MAFITWYSFHKLKQSMKLKTTSKIDLRFFLDNIFDNPNLYEFLNQADLKNLLKNKILFSNNLTHLVEYKEVDERSDNLNYVIELKGKLKYHLNSECPKLHNGFKNFILPTCVTNLRENYPSLHETIVKNIRKWFKINNYTIKQFELGEIDNKLLSLEFNKIFPSKYNINRIPRRQNSAVPEHKWYIEELSKGVIDFSLKTEGMDVEIELPIKVNQLIRFCSNENRQILSKYSFLIGNDDEYIHQFIEKKIFSSYHKTTLQYLIKKHSLEQVKYFWKKYNQLKKDILEDIEEQIKEHHSFDDSKFDERLLDDFNFEPCRHCYPQKYKEK